MEQRFDNVTPLRNAIIDSDAKTAFIQALGATFDEYVSANGGEPEAVVFVLGGVTQKVMTGYHLTGLSLGGPLSMLALSVACIEACLHRAA